MIWRYNGDKPVKRDNCIWQLRCTGVERTQSFRYIIARYMTDSIVETFGRPA
jgi:hypothetical protein